MTRVMKHFIGGYMYIRIYMYTYAAKCLNGWIKRKRQRKKNYEKLHKSLSTVSNNGMFSIVVD